MVDILARTSRQLMFAVFIYVVNLIAYSTIIGVFIDTIEFL